MASLPQVDLEGQATCLKHEDDYLSKTQELESKTNFKIAESSVFIFSKLFD